MTVRAGFRIPRPARVEWQRPAAVLIGLALGGFLISSQATIYRLQGDVSTFATLLPIGYAFAAGMVATANPCGVLLLPSLVACHLGRSEAARRSAPERAKRALLLGIMATLGFVALFSVVGLAVGAGGQALITAFPLGGFLVGVALAGLGLWLAVSGRELGILAAGRAMEHGEPRDDLRSLFMFGVAYGVTSLCCTLPVFLVVAGSALATGGAAAATVQFVSYALGMGAVLTVIALGATFFHDTVVRSVRGLVPYVHALAAAFLLGAGLYVAAYWLAYGLSPF